ncbi:hypothetical protein diail_8873 [Diaporthe ilicicola]|nr:hypothetical protein diail_8873 [Diaporthe ilicicola]
MRNYNNGPDEPISNTYQAYLKVTRGVICEHLEVAQREGWAVGNKLVRGAYILNDVRDRIHDTKADTDNNYNSIVHYLLFRDFDGISGKNFPRNSLFVCGHNNFCQVPSDRGQGLGRSVPMFLARPVDTGRVFCYSD